MVLVGQLQHLLWQINRPLYIVYTCMVFYLLGWYVRNTGLTLPRTDGLF